MGALIEQVPLNISQHIALHIPIVDLCNMLLVSKTCNFHYSQSSIWLEVGIRINIMLKDMAEPIPNMSPGLFHRIALHFPSHWGNDRKEAHLLYLVKENCCGNDEGIVLNLVAVCNKLSCTGGCCPDSYINGETKRARRQVGIRRSSPGILRVKWAMGSHHCTGVWGFGGTCVFMHPAMWVTNNERIIFRPGWWSLDKLIKPYHKLIKLI